MVLIKEKTNLKFTSNWDQKSTNMFVEILRQFLLWPPKTHHDNIDIDKHTLPRGESLELVMKRLIPYFDREIIHHELLEHDRTVLIVTHGSIVRSLIKYLSNVSDDDISKINVPTGVPLVFELDNDGNLTKDYYYLDPELAKKGIEKVKNEGQA